MTKINEKKITDYLGSESVSVSNFSDEDGELSFKNIEDLAIHCFDKYYTEYVITMMDGICHEMKSPLQAFRTLTNLLDLSLENKTEEELKEDLKNISYEMSQVRNDISDILDAMSSCRNKQKDSYLKSEFNIRETIEGCVKKLRFREDFKNANVEIKIHFQESLPELVYGYQSISNHILTNILANSCNAISAKKNKKGNISVDVSYVKNNVIVRVTDTGIGIPKDESQRIFEPFYTKRLVEGSSGLGLFICKSMASKIDASVKLLSSKIGKTVFVYQFPNKKE